MGNSTEFYFRTSDVAFFVLVITKGTDQSSFLFCLGGTVDITVHEIQSDGNVKEVAVPSGGPWGGTTVDENFVALLKQCFGDGTIDHLMNKNSQAWLKLMTTFGTAKQNFKSAGNPALRFSLDYAFCMEIIMMMKKSIEEVLKDVNGVSFKNGILCIDHNVACRLFSCSITQIVKHVHSELRMTTDVKYVLLVGGYGMCDMLKERCKTEFGHKVTILTPHDAQLAIVKGAVLFGHNLLQITSRVARFTYGTNARMLFKDGVHNPEKKVIDDEGVERCEDCFDVFIAKDEKVNPDEKRLFYYSPAVKGQTRMDFTLYKGERTKVMYTDEPGVEVVKKMALQSKDGPLGKSIEVQVSFGQTEILVKARDKSKDDNFILVTTVTFM